MSASLVGSEMCIRDRDPSPRSAPGAPAGPSRRRHRTQRAKWRRTPRTRPVSYTHLTLPTICSV
eukprot:11545894-Alexandrium_andersonii.AAC.1